ncbi:MAG: hypothetical protein WCO54_04490 [Bacteroidota bacterium]
MNEVEFKKVIDTLKADLKIYDEMIKEVSADMIAEGFTEYPVFIATEHDVKIGELIIDKNDMAGTYNVYATTIDEMVETNLILEAKKNDFIKAYKDPKKFMCVMLATEKLASFIFVPFAKNSGNEEEDYLNN